MSKLTTRIERLEREHRGDNQHYEFDVHWADEPISPCEECGATETCPHRVCIVLTWATWEGSNEHRTT